MLGVTTTPVEAPIATWRLLGGDSVSPGGPPGDADNDGIPDEVEAGVGRNPLVKYNDIFGDARLFAMQQYRDFIRREGDAPGIAFWTNQITTNTQDRAETIRSFFDSYEFQVLGSPVVRLYFAYFLRIPDYAGVDFWMGQSRAGTPLATISQNFAASAEFDARYGALNNSQFVDLVYQNVLGRAPDAPGKAFWQGQLDANAMSRGQVMLGFSESDEYRISSIGKVFVTMMYVGMLRRAPEQAGFDFWVDYVNRGNPRLSLIRGFLASPEYRARFLP